MEEQMMPATFSEQTAKEKHYQLELLQGRKFKT